MAKKARKRSIDPSRTALLRRKFQAEMQRRFKSISKAIDVLFIKEKLLGEKRKMIAFNLDQGEFLFASNPNKVRMFRKWLQEQINNGVLTVVGGIKGQPWTATYVISAYRQGIMRAYTDVHKPELSKTPQWYGGAKEQFLRDAFLQPVMMSQVEMLAMRAFDQLQGVTQDMSKQMGLILADGLANGKSPITIAREMKNTITKLTKTRALLIARTEIIRAHAEGQLDGFGLLKIYKVSAEVEFTTAGDLLVCPKCADLEGKVFTLEAARGIIPIHCNCRCSWNGIIEETPKATKKSGRMR